jgi:hypothetical protein
LPLFAVLPAPKLRNNYVYNKRGIAQDSLFRPKNAQIGTKNPQQNAKVIFEVIKVNFTHII